MQRNDHGRRQGLYVYTRGRQGFVQSMSASLLVNKLVNSYWWYKSGSKVD